MRHMKMKELPNSSRPYERCMREGAEHLTDAELLSIILRTGSKAVSYTHLTLPTGRTDSGLKLPWRGYFRAFASFPAAAYVCERNRKGEGSSADVYW